MKHKILKVGVGIIGVSALVALILGVGSWFLSAPIAVAAAGAKVRLDEEERSEKDSKR